HEILVLFLLILVVHHRFGRDPPALSPPLDQFRDHSPPSSFCVRAFDLPRPPPAAHPKNAGTLQSVSAVSIATCRVVRAVENVSPRRATAAAAGGHTPLRRGHGPLRPDPCPGTAQRQPRHRPSQNLMPIPP